MTSFYISPIRLKYIETPNPPLSVFSGVRIHFSLWKLREMFAEWECSVDNGMNEFPE